MKINGYNLRNINRDINGIINDWADRIEIWNIKSKESQPGWNDLMKEIHSDTQYDKLIGVPVQLTDMTPVELQTDVGGDKYVGEMVLYIPLQYVAEVIDDITGDINKITTDIRVNEDSLFILHNNYDNPWRIKTLKRLPGETIVRVIKMIGGD